MSSFFFNELTAQLFIHILLQLIPSLPLPLCKFYNSDAGNKQSKMSQGDSKVSTSEKGYLHLMSLRWVNLFRTTYEIKFLEAESLRLFYYT